MSDDPSKTGQDRRTVSDQDHELQYFYSALQDEFPDAGRDEIVAAVETGKQKIAPSTDRDELTAAVRKILES